MNILGGTEIPQTRLTADEIDRERAITPGVANVTHFNHAGSSLPTRDVLDTQVNYLTREAEIGGYEAAATSVEQTNAVYGSIAKLIGASSHEISRAEHATVAWNAAFWSLPMERGQRIITAEAEYGANAVAFLRAQERYGLTIEVVPSTPAGSIDLDAFEATLSDDVAVVAITHVPTNGGLINPAAEIGSLLTGTGIPYLLDACQSAGQIDLDVTALGCDMLTATGRKFLRGPRGTGFLYVSESILPRLVPDQPDHHGAPWIAADRYELRDDARRFEHWEFNHAAWHGLGAAIEHASQIGLGRIESTVKERADQLRLALAENGFQTFDIGEEKSGIITTDCSGVAPSVAKALLAERSINVSVTTPDSTWWDALRRDLSEMLRVSVHYITTSEEISLVVDALVEIRDLHSSTKG